MNEINIDEGRILASKLLSSEKADYQLYHLSPVTFAVYNRTNKSVVIAFASAALGEFILEIGDPKISGVCYRRHEDIASSQPAASRSLTLILTDRRSIILDSFDRIWIQDYHPTGETQEHALWSPHKLWGCSPFKHFDMMLLTDPLVQAIETISDEGQQLHLAHILWQEFRLVVDPTQMAEPIQVTGEFLEFSVRRFRKVLFVFDLLSDPQAEELEPYDDDEPVF